jgi:3-deoxy-D-manno-octulosonic-acid transferase
MLLYRLVRFITFPVFWIVLRLRNSDNPGLFYEKIGRPTRDRPKGNLVWIHCHNLSESRNTIQEIINDFSNRIILLTYNNADGYVKFESNIICQFAPIDSYLTVRRFLQFWEPMIAIRIGSELRPNQLALLKKMNIPSFLLNGEVSNKSYKRWKWARRLARKTMRNLTFVWALDNMQTLRLANMGARDIKSQEQVPGNNKIREILYGIKQWAR